MLPTTSAFAVPTGPGDPAGTNRAQLSETSLRVATIQSDLSGDNPEELVSALMRGTDRRATHVADQLSLANADVVVLTGMDATEEAVEVFNSQYLNNPDDLREDVDYSYSYLGVGSKGLQSGADLNSDGVIGSAEDAWGQGAFAEQGSVVVLSKYPIDQDQVNSVSSLKWQEVENDMLHHTDFSGALAASIPVMSTGLWDIPIEYRGKQVHIVATQLQPDAQDQEFAKARQFDELKVVGDYIDGKKYVRTEDGDQAAGLKRYVVAGALGLQEDSVDRVDPFLKKLNRENAINDSGSYLVPDSSWQILGQGRVEAQEPLDAQPLPGTESSLMATPNTLIWTDVQF